MKYFLGPWRWRTDDGEPYFAPPAGAVGAIDVGTLPEMSVGGSERKGCLCWTDGVGLGSDYDSLGNGDVREINRTGKIASIFANTIGSLPDGDHLHEMITDCFLGGSDPDGETGPMPIVPSIDGWMDLNMQGHGRVKGERFEWGRTDGHTKRLKRMLRRQFTDLIKDAGDGKLKDKVHHLRVLDDWCRKYHVDEWREFVPDKLQKDVPGRVPRETTYTDDFNRADSTGLGAGWSNILGSGFDVFSNQCRGTNAADTTARSRYDSDVSSADHYCQAETISYGSVPTSNVGVSCRFASAANTQYAWITKGSTPYRRLFKVVAGAGTQLSSDTTVNATGVHRISANGSAIKVYIAGSEIVGLAVTDTSIASGLRGGIQGLQSTTASARTIQDDFEVADLGGGTAVILTQLASTFRGVKYGVFHKVVY